MPQSLKSTFFDLFRTEHPNQPSGQEKIMLIALFSIFSPFSDSNFFSDFKKYNVMRLTYWSTHLKNIYIYIYIFFFLQNNACRLENVKLDILLGSLLLYIYAQLRTYFIHWLLWWEKLILILFSSHVDLKLFYIFYWNLTCNSFHAWGKNFKWNISNFNFKV